jgi:hypothetical protein
MAKKRKILRKQRKGQFFVLYQEITLSRIAKLFRAYSYVSIVSYSPKKYRHTQRGGLKKKLIIDKP